MKIQSEWQVQLFAYLCGYFDMGISNSVIIAVHVEGLTLTVEDYDNMCTAEFYVRPELFTVAFLKDARKLWRGIPMRVKV